MNFIEKRSDQRFTGAITIELKHGNGVTRDFSSEGIYFVTDQQLCLGEQLDFIMHLHYADPAWPLRLCCRGEVVRIEPDLEKIGAAVTIGTHWFEQDKSNA